MKCIKTKSNVIQRVSDEAAINAVFAGTAKYVARSEWKTTTRGAAVAQVAKTRNQDEEPKKAKKAKKLRKSKFVAEDSKEQKK